MNVCDYCQTEEIIYEDRDGIQAYCQDCFEHLDKEYIDGQGIKKI